MEELKNNSVGKIEDVKIPVGPPPDFTPKKTPDLYKTELSAISGAKGKFTYIWLKDGRSFWVYIINAGRNSITGYKWNKFGWIFYGISLKNLESFYNLIPNNP